MPFAIAATALTPVSSSPAATVDHLRRCRSSSELRQLHARILKSDILSAHPLVVRRLLSSLSDAGDRLHAASILCHIPEPDALLYVSVIGDFSEAGDVDHCFDLYTRLLTSLEADLRGAEFSLPSLLKVCAKSSASEEGRQLHAQVSKNPLFLRDPFVANSVLRMYLDLGRVEAAALWFDRMPVRDVISYNSMISGCFKNGNVEMASKTFDEMRHKDVIAYNSMIDGLMKCGRCNDATDLFDRMVVRDVISWTSMISGSVLNGRSEEAVGLFRRMLRAGVLPDEAAIVNVLSAIADLGLAEEGKWVHDYVRRSSRLKSCSGVVGSALIDMYSKCGLVDEAYLVFSSIAHRGRVGDWNSMISGLAMHGLGQEAMEIFEQMEDKGIEPDGVTFLGLLKACNHSGLVKEGELIYRRMREKYHLELSVQHYGCLIDLLGRAGLVEEARIVMTEMPMEPDVLAWKSVLSACVKHVGCYVPLAEEAAARAMELAPDDSSNYVLLSNVYAKCGRWADVEKVRSTMRARGVQKAPGCSAVMVDGNVHEFLVGREEEEEMR